MIQDGNLPVELVCPICASSADQLSRLYSMHFNIDGGLGDTYWLYRCRQCGMGITVPRPRDSSLAKFYETGTYTKAGGRISFLVDRLLDSLQDVRLSGIESLCNPPGNLLDVGCGKGRFLARAVMHGWNVQGVETSPRQIAAARKRYRLAVFESELQEMSFADRSFQVVTAWHVLEHFPDPNPIMNEVHRILKPEGLFVLEVPNLDSWQAKIGRERWFQLDVPRHLGHYSKNSLWRLLDKHDFSPTRYETFSPELGPFGMLQSLQNIIGLPPNWLFRWLKRSVPEKEIGMLILNLCMATMMVAPATLLEVVASLTNRHGGVMRVFARAK